MKLLTVLLIAFECSIASNFSLPEPETNVQRILIFGDEKPIAFSECLKDSYPIYVIHQNFALAEK